MICANHAYAKNKKKKKDKREMNNYDENGDKLSNLDGRGSQVGRASLRRK